jgi:hypothetical protein
MEMFERGMGKRSSSVATGYFFIYGLLHARDVGGSRLEIFWTGWGELSLEAYIKAVPEPVNDIGHKFLIWVVLEKGFKSIYIYRAALGARDRVVRPYPFAASGLEWGGGFPEAMARGVVLLTAVLTSVEKWAGCLRASTATVVIVTEDFTWMAISIIVVPTVASRSRAATSTRAVAPVRGWGLRWHQGLRRRWGRLRTGWLLLL